MSRIKNLSGRAWEKMLRESGVNAFNGPQGRILYVLWEHGTLNITEVGQLTSLAKTTLTSMLDRMETAGLVRRVPDKRNRRQIFIEVTEKAKDCREQYERLSDGINGLFYKGFTETEIAEFEEKLRRIVENFENEGV